MTLAAGTKLGPYEILSPLGAGGMGEVYLAKDSNLDRQVAVKVLPDVIARDLERVARFQREAKLLASLNHPNIAAVYGFDEHNSTKFLVLEYVEGETLAGKLKVGPLAPEDALEVSKQIAEALEAAHERGVIHRDLKPANVMVRRDGTVKVLDFGLAKALSDEPPESASEMSPTITADFTRPGVVLGTAAYMSPEQARGRALDKRTDIWSFGVILFECMSGMRLFAGENATDSMGAIMHREPDWSQLPATTPPTVQLLLRRCLTKDRRRRLHDIADARIELENSIIDPSGSSLGLAQSALAAAGRSRRAGVGLIPLIVCLGAAVALTWFLKPAPPEAPRIVHRARIPTPEDVTVRSWPYPTLSPDGSVSSLRFLLEGKSAVGIRFSDQEDYTIVPGTENAYHTFFSPDGQWMAYAQGGKLKKMSIRGGPPLTLCDAPRCRGGVWTEEDMIIFCPERRDLVQVSAAGGQPETLVKVLEAEKGGSYAYPSLLPDKKGILFTKVLGGGDWDKVSVWLRTTDGELRQVAANATHGKIVGGRYLVFLRQGTLMAARFDMKTLSPIGTAVPILEGVTIPFANGPAEFSIDNHGTLLYMSGSALRENRFVSIDMAGKETRIGEQVSGFMDFDVSPDDRYIVTEVDDGSNRRLGILDRTRDVLRQDPVLENVSEPVYSPDGNWILYGTSNDDGNRVLMRKAVGRTDAPELLYASEPHTDFVWDIAPDGRTLAMLRILDTTSDGDIYLLTLDEHGKPIGDATPLVEAPRFQWHPTFSPDGKWICYGSGLESGVAQVFVVPVDGSAAPVQASVDGGQYCGWSRTEDRLFFSYRLGTAIGVWTAGYTITDGRFEPGVPEELFEKTGLVPRRAFRMANTKDEFIFVADTDASETRREPILVVNWADEIEARLPAVKN